VIVSNQIKKGFLQSLVSENLVNISQSKNALEARMWLSRAVSLSLSLWWPDTQSAP